MNKDKKKISESSLIYIVDDSDESVQVTVNILKIDRYRIAVASSGKEALSKMDKVNPNLVLLDLRMPGLSGEKVLEIMTEQYPHIPIIIVTSENDTDIIVNCMKAGAFDFLVKPLEATRTVTSVQRALSWGEKEAEIESLKEQILNDKIHNPKSFEHIITNNRKMLDIFKYIEAVSKTEQPVLIAGDTGSGKELIAKAVHLSSSKNGEFVTVNVAGLDDQLFSDTLFGHVKGGFTGADKKRDGLIEKASGGTLFLDEVGDLSPMSQIKLLRLLQQGEYLPIGTDDCRYSKARIVLATNRNLDELIEKEVFRKDLYYRLKAHCIYLPPLYQRNEDIPMLLDYFLETASKETGKNKPVYHQVLIDLLQSYHFPGNIRELKGIIYEAVIRHDEKMLSTKVFSDYISAATKDESVKLSYNSLSPREYYNSLEHLPSIEEATAILTNEAMERCNGNKSLAAKMLKISRTTLLSRLKKDKQIIK